MEKYITNTIAPEIRFIAYCVEIYKQSKNLPGFEVAALFTKYNIWDYLAGSHGALHTTGAAYTVEDIDAIINAGEWRIANCGERPN